jgi:hypothetical protein
MVHDWITRRRIHPVYAIGNIALFLFALEVACRALRNMVEDRRPIVDALR